MRARRDHSEKEIQESHAFLYVKTENDVCEYICDNVSLVALL